MTANTLTSPAFPSTGLTSRLAECLIPGQYSRIQEWTLEQLNILPYQHLLEIGYGSGKMLQTVTRKLKTGFLAAIDSSAAMYQRASRRNRRSIDQELLQLHIGGLQDLPYPSQYFHTIYGANIHLSWKDPEIELLRLANLLKSGGRLVMVIQPQGHRDEKALRMAVGNLQQDYLKAGLTDIRIRYKDVDSLTAITVTGYKA